MSKIGLEFYLTKTSQGIVLSLIIIGVLFAYNDDSLVGQLCLRETLPGYKAQSSLKAFFKQLPPEGKKVLTSKDEKYDKTINTFNRENVESIKFSQNDNGLIGLEEIVYQPETSSMEEGTSEHFNNEAITINNVSSLKNIKTLKNKFYIVDKSTDMTNDLFNIETFMAQNLKISPSGDEPKVLIFHTHSHEMYSNSVDSNEGVIGVGERLKVMLEEKYGIKSIHNISRFDVVDGKPKVIGAYERMEPEIKKILEENPSIEVVIDLHRDGVPSTTKLVKDINGKQTAQIMFFNGLSKVYKNNELKNIDSLPNAYLKDNLAFSFNMQLAANHLYPGISRKVYLNAYRYSLHMSPKSLLIEVGAQTNTKEEAFNAVEPLTDMLAHVLL